MSKIITISREFGSGGRELGKRLAEKLGIAYYDREIITEIAKQTGLSEQYIQNVSEKGAKPYAFQFAKSFATYTTVQSNQTEILISQTKVIKEIAQRGDCVIVGRGANTILREENPMNIFVYAAMESKINRCIEKAQENKEMARKELEKRIIQIDNNRKKYNNLISNQVWGEKSNYHLCINTTNIEIKTIIPALADYTENWFRRKK